MSSQPPTPQQPQPQYQPYQRRPRPQQEYKPFNLFDIGKGGSWDFKKNGGLGSLLNFGLLGLMNGQHPIFNGGILGTMMNQQQSPPWAMRPRGYHQRPGYIQESQTPPPPQQGGY